MKFFISIVLTFLFAVSVFAQTRAEVIVPTTYLRKSPSSVAEKVYTVQKGASLNIENAQNKNGWHYVSTLDSKVKGWINGNTIRLIEQAQAVDQTPQTTVPTSPLPASTPTLASEPTVKSTPAPVTKRPVPRAENPPPAVRPTPAPEVSPTPEVPPTSKEDNEVLRIETEEVSLNVRVVDSNNRPVKKLNQSDFKIYEDDALQPITSLATTEVPIINALVIDNSRSLRSQLKKVIEAGKIIVGTNRPRDESSIVRFVSSDKIEVVQDFTTSKSSLNDALDNLFVEGGQTAIIDAVYQTAKKVAQYQNSQKKEDVKLRTLILVSDGDDRESTYKEQQLFELLRNSNVQIYAIGFINDLSKESDPSGISRQEKAKTFLTRLAQETGGKVFFPNSIDELSQIASDISGELHTQYVISYTPTNETHDGTFRKIKVMVTEGVNKEKRIAVTRTGRNSSPK